MFTLNRAFISNSETQKLQIFRIINNSQKITLDQIESRLILGPVKIKRYINDLNKDLLLLSNRIEIKQTIHHEYYIQKTKFSSVSIFSELAYNYSCHSPVFLLLKILVGSKDMTIPELSQYINVSNTHLYRIIKKANIFLSNYNIFVKRDKNNFLSFYGSELNIRIFSYSFISQCIPNNVWIFSNLDKKHIVQSSSSFIHDAHMKTSDSDKVFIIWQIMLSRISKKDFVPNIPENQLEMLKFYTSFSVNLLNKHIRFSPNISNEIIYQEYLYLNFMFQVFLPESINSESKRRVSNATLASTNRGVLFIRELISKWKLNFNINLPEERSNDLLTHIVLLFNTAIVFDINLLKVWQIDQEQLIKQSDKSSKELESISEFLLKFAQDNQFDGLDLKYFKKTQIPYIANALFLEYKLLQNKVVNICIETTIEYNIRTFVMNKIQLIYSSSTVTFVSKIDQADLVISDRYEEIDSSKNLIIIVDLLSKEEWKNILNQIQQLIVARIFI